MPSPRPKPTVLKRLEGTYRADRANPLEPEPRRGRVIIPSWLKGEARTAWIELADLLGPHGTNVLALQDRAALALLCDAYREYRLAKERVERDGMMVTQKVKAGYVRIKHPLIPVYENAWVRTMRALVEFGLTPSSKSKTSTQGQKQADDPLAELLNRKSQPQDSETEPGN